MVSKKLKRTISIAVALMMTCSSMVFAQESDYQGH